MSAFFFGYLPMQIGGALLSRRFGAKSVLTYSALLWSAFTAVTPLAARCGFGVLIVCRVCMGLAEGVAFPAVFHYLASWIPKAERGRAVSTFLVGVHVGTTVALVLSPKLIAWHSWPMVFYVFGGAGFIWILLWSLLARDRDGDPEEDGGSRTPTVPGTGQVSVPHDDQASHAVRPMADSPAETRAGVRKTLALGNTRSFPGMLLSPAERRAFCYILSSTPCLAICFTQFMLSFCHCASIIPTTSCVS
jgi:MFS family permease